MKYSKKIKIILYKIKEKISKVYKSIYPMISSIFAKRRLFVATWIEGKNWGDDYLSQSLVQYLESQKVNYKIIKTNLHLDYNYLTKKDILIIGGGGLWGPNKTGKLEEKLFKIWMKTKASLIISNIGIESFNDSETKKFTDLMKKSKLTSFRDEESYKIAQQILGNEKIIWGADNTYLSPSQIERSPIPKCIGVNLCGPEQENNSKKYPTEIIIKRLLQLKLLNFDIKSVVFSYDNLLSDYKYCVQVDPTCSKFFSEIPFKNCELFIGMHFHSCILALQNEIPTIGINYSDKVKRLFLEYDLAEFCIEPENIDSLNKIDLMIESVYKNKDQIILKIREGNNRAKKRLIPFNVKLKQILNSEQK